MKSPILWGGIGLIFFAWLSMYLFLNTIIAPGIFVLFENHQIVAKQSWEQQWAEYDALLENIEAFLGKNNVTLTDLEGIIVVRGPGGFTSTRIVSLIVNTWRSLYHIPTQDMTLFDVLLQAGGSYPICIKANRSEYLIQMIAKGLPEIVPIQSVPVGHYTGIGQESDFPEGNIIIASRIDYEKLIKNFQFVPSDVNVEPYYIKKPNIT